MVEQVLEVLFFYKILNKIQLSTLKTQYFIKIMPLMEGSFMVVFIIWKYKIQQYKRIAQVLEEVLSM